MQDVVHVGWQRGEQRVVGPVGTHLGDDDGPQRDGQQHGQQGQGPAMTCTLPVQLGLDHAIFRTDRTKPHVKKSSNPLGE